MTPFKLATLLLATAVAGIVGCKRSAPTPTNWYIDAVKGSSRYDSAINPQGICDGKGPDAPNGTAPGQHCPFADVRFLAYNGQYTTVAQPWIIAGGDIVHIAAGKYRVGYTGPNSKDYTLPNGYSVAIAGNPIAPALPPPPSGTASHHTMFIGAGSDKTQIFGGYGAFAVFDLSGASFVDLDGIEMTRHSQCVRIGAPALPSYCSSNYPMDDFAQNGIVTNTSTHDIGLQDLWIHGFTSRGIIGPIGGTITANNVDIAYNAGAGWDFDDGTARASVNAQLIANGLIIEWNGCNQAYPGTGAVACYSQSSGGYGDGIGTPAGTCVSATVTNSIFRYNTQDGYDMLHNDTGACKQVVSHSMSYGNNGSQFKWGPANNGSSLTDSTIVANCARLSAPFPGQPASFNANLQDYCRANDAIALVFYDTTSMTLSHNTIITYSPTTYDILCGDANTCAHSKLTMADNITLGYTGPRGQPGAYCTGGCNETKELGSIVRTGNLYYGLKGLTLVEGEKEADPQFVNQPTFTSEASLDNYNTNLTATSAAQGLGAPGTIVPTGGSPTPIPPPTNTFTFTVQPPPVTVTPPLMHCVGTIDSTGAVTVKCQ